MRKLLPTSFLPAFAFALTCAFAALPAHAQSPEAAIAARKAAMDLVGALTGQIKNAVTAKADVKPLKEAAEAIAAWGKAYPGLVFPGTDKGDTKLAAAALTDSAGFAKASAALSDAGVKLAAAADANDKDAFAAAFGDVGKACGGCHRTYRNR